MAEPLVIAATAFFSVILLGATLVGLNDWLEARLSGGWNGSPQSGLGNRFRLPRRPRAELLRHDRPQERAGKLVGPGVVAHFGRAPSKAQASGRLADVSSAARPASRSQGARVVTARRIPGRLR